MTGGRWWWLQRGLVCCGLLLGEVVCVSRILAARIDEFESVRDPRLDIVIPKKHRIRVTTWRRIGGLEGRCVR